MEQDWGEKILSYSKCSPKYATQTAFAKICKGGLFEGSFGLVEALPSTSPPGAASQSTPEREGTPKTAGSGSLDQLALEQSNARREKQARAAKDLRRIWSKIRSPSFNNNSGRGERSLRTPGSSGTPRAVPEDKEQDQEHDQDIDAGLVIMTYMRATMGGETSMRNTNSSQHPSGSQYPSDTGPANASITVLEYLQKAWKLINEGDIESGVNGPIPEEPFSPMGGGGPQSPSARYMSKVSSFQTNIFRKSRTHREDSNLLVFKVGRP